MLESLSRILLPLLVLISMASFGRMSRKSWLSPSAFCPMVWAVYILLPVLVAPYFFVSSTAVSIIVLLVFAAQIGAFVGEGHRSSQRSRTFRTEPGNGPKPILLDRILRFSLLCSLLALIGTMYLTHLSLRQSGLALSLDGVLGLGRFLSNLRYQEEGFPLLVRLLVIWMYPAGLLGGMACGMALTRGKRLLSFAPFVPALVLAIVVASRAGIMFMLVTWVAGFLSTKLWLSGGSYRPVNGKLILCLLSLGAFVVSVGTGVQLLRGGLTSDLRSLYESGYMQKVFVGYLGGFSWWFETQEPGGPALGAYTISGLFDLLGLQTRTLGLYDVPARLGYGQEGNIYTAFRGLIEDFTLPGALVFCLLFGVVSGWAYRRSCRRNFRWVVVLAGFYASTLWSLVASLFVYNGLVLAWIVATLVVVWPRNKMRSRLSSGRMPRRLFASKPGAGKRAQVVVWRRANG